MKNRKFLRSSRLAVMGIAWLSALLFCLFINPAEAFADISDYGRLRESIPIRSLAASGVSKMNFVEDAEKGTLTVIENGTPVLTYRFGDQLREGVDPKFARSCYVHPLFSLDGQPLTDDFPADHVHHHGLFWGWPVVKVRGQTTSNWEVGVPSLRQRFVRWLKRDAASDGAVLRVENAWKLGESEVVAQEVLTMRVHPADSEGRAIDVEIMVTAVGGPLELQGTPDQNKGYGGLCFRSAPLLKGAAMTTDQGRLKEDVVNTSFKWADISTDKLGVAVFVPAGHPDAPLHWLIRNSYAGVINPSWPGLKPVTLLPGRPVELRYRVYVHRGDAVAGRVAEKCRLYSTANSRSSLFSANSTGALSGSE